MLAHRAELRRRRWARARRSSTGATPAARPGPFTYREGKALAMRELAAREGIDLAASYAYSDSESDLPMLRAVGHPVAVNPDAALRARRARGGLGGHALRAARPAAEGRRRPSRFAAAGGRPEPGPWRCASDEPTTSSPTSSARSATSRGASPTRRSRRRRRSGTASTASRASCSARLGELGLMGVCVPEEHGGAGADFLAYVLVLEELSRADAGVGVTVAVHTSAGTLPLLSHGTPEQVGRLVPPLAQGHELAAFALTESGSGSDAGAMRTRAIRPPTGTPASAGPSSGSPTARTPTAFLVFARDPDDARRRFVVRRGARGLHGHARGGEAGAELLLDRRPRASRTRRPSASASPGAGHAHRASRRSTAGASASPPRRSGIAQAALDVAAGYAKERHAFGAPDRAASAPSSRSSPTCRPRSRRPAR